MLLLHCVHTYLFISTRSRRSIPVLSDSVDHTLTYPSTAGSCSHALGDQARAVIRLIVVFKWTCRADVSGRSFKPGGHSVHADPYVSMLVVVHAPGYRAGGPVEGTDRRHIFNGPHACPSYLHWGHSYRCKSLVSMCRVLCILIPNILCINILHIYV